MKHKESKEYIIYDEVMDRWYMILGHPKHPKFKIDVTQAVYIGIHIASENYDQIEVETIKI